ncbi:tRNA1(Val) (adenine(37)-N6)-methyltransferase [Acetobacter okinawensis]|uniref:tRNA1(Val) (adenine(37)-N6)-methyltransferase n=1 Tax=Acetobacter okinawensis TaxID=1076594 RepID=UPI001F571B67|nr:methyltransferase [Acetobacter okinawensis]MCP1211860.1 methyltransferase [Acetobacter okinawensis]
MMQQAPSSHLPATSHGTLLRGRIAYSQFQQGYRTGLEPILMAAAVPARHGQHVLEVGCGAGAGLLCLMHRVPDLHGTGIEKDSETAELARTNLLANKKNQVSILDASFPEGVPEHLRFDHCMTNPPWHATTGTASPEPRRDLARRMGMHTLPLWVKGAASILRHKGSLTLALPTALTDRAVAELSANGFGGITLYPFWPKTDREARILLVQARLGVKSPARVLAGLTLHEADGAFTPQARDVLENGTALPGL